MNLRTNILLAAAGVTAVAALTFADAPVGTTTQAVKSFDKVQTDISSATSRYRATGPNKVLKFLNSTGVTVETTAAGIKFHGFRNRTTLQKIGTSAGQPMWMGGSWPTTGLPIDYSCNGNCEFTVANKHYLLTQTNAAHPIVDIKVAAPVSGDVIYVTNADISGLTSNVQVYTSNATMVPAYTVGNKLQLSPGATVGFKYHANVWYQLAEIAFNNRTTLDRFGAGPTWNGNAIAPSTYLSEQSTNVSASGVFWSYTGVYKGRIIAGEKYRVWHSTDNGKSFQLLYNFADSVADAYCAYLMPCVYIDSRGYYYASMQASTDCSLGNAAGLWRSTNAGTSWSRVSLDGINAFKNISGATTNESVVRGLTEDKNGYLYGYTYQSFYNIRENVPRIYKSVDGGATFTTVLLGDTAGVGRNRRHMHGVVYDPYQDIIYATLGEHRDFNVSTNPYVTGDPLVMKSTNGGADWTNVITWSSGANAAYYNSDKFYAFVGNVGVFPGYRLLSIEYDGRVYISRTTNDSDYSAALSEPYYLIDGTDSWTYNWQWGYNRTTGTVYSYTRSPANIYASTNSGQSFTKLKEYSRRGDSTSIESLSMYDNKLIFSMKNYPSLSYIYTTENVLLPTVVLEENPTTPSLALVHQYNNQAIADGNIMFSDNTVGDSSTVKHGYLPKLSGSVSEVLRGDGSWGAGGSGSPGGTDTRVQVNASGAFAGYSAFIYSNSLKRLQLYANGTAPTRGVALYQHNDGIQAFPIAFYKSRGTVTSPTTIAANDILGAFAGSGYDGSAYKGGSSIYYRAIATPGTTYTPSQIELNTTDATTIYTARVKSGGSLYIQGNFSTAGNAYAVKYYGDGSELTGVGAGTPSSTVTAASAVAAAGSSAEYSRGDHAHGSLPTYASISDNTAALEGYYYGMTGTAAKTLTLPETSIANRGKTVFAGMVSGASNWSLAGYGGAQVTLDGAADTTKPMPVYPAYVMCNIAGTNLWSCTTLGRSLTGLSVAGSTGDVQINSGSSTLAASAINDTSPDISIVNRNLAIKQGSTLGFKVYSGGSVEFYDTAGNVSAKWDAVNKYHGINTTTPGSQLHVTAASGTTATLNVATLRDASGQGGQIDLMHSRTGKFSDSGDIIGLIRFSSYSTTPTGITRVVGAEINGTASENITSTKKGTHIVFKNCSTGGATLTERMRIKESGVINVAPRTLPESCAAGDIYVNSSDNKLYGCGTPGTPGTWNAFWYYDPRRRSAWPRIE